VKKSVAEKQWSAVNLRYFRNILPTGAIPITFGLWLVTVARRYREGAILLRAPRKAGKTRAAIAGTPWLWSNMSRQEEWVMSSEGRRLQADIDRMYPAAAYAVELKAPEQPFVLRDLLTEEQVRLIKQQH
jgi:hypothetical protein